MPIIGDYNMRVVVQNAEAVIANLNAAHQSARKNLKDAVGESAARIEQRTVDLCPKRSFYMSEHVRVKFSKKGFAYTIGWDERDFIGTTDERGRPRSFYPLFVEFGTRHMRAQPSLSVAFREEQPRFQAAIKKALDDAFQRARRA